MSGLFFLLFILRIGRQTIADEGYQDEVKVESAQHAELRTGHESLGAVLIDC